MLAITDRRCEKRVLAITDRRTETGADDSCCKAGKVPSRIAASIQQQSQLALGLCFSFVLGGVRHGLHAVVVVSLFQLLGW